MASRAFRALFCPVLALVVACSEGASTPARGEEPAPEPPATPEAAVAEDEPVLFGLETRDHQVWMHAGDRYTIKTKDGTVLASSIDRVTLDRDFADLAADMERMVDVLDGGRHIGIGGD